MFHLRTTVVARCEHFRENSVLAIVPFYAKRQPPCLQSRFSSTIVHLVKRHWNVTHMLHVEKVHCCSNYMGINNKAKEVLCSTEVFLDCLWDVGSADEVGQLFQCSLITE